MSRTRGVLWADRWRTKFWQWQGQWAGLNWEAIDTISSMAFRKQRPYPWTSIPDSLTPEAFECLRETLPDISMFDRKVGINRAYSQTSHDRAILHYRPDLNLQPPWKGFVAELEGKSYESFLRHMFGLSPGRRIILTVEWYYAWQGCSVSSHCDARRKLGTHIFYFNTEADWDAMWGGGIGIVDDANHLEAGVARRAHVLSRRPPRRRESSAPFFV